MKRLRALIKTANQRSVADGIGISSTYLSEIILGKRPMSEKVVNALGYKSVVRYHKLKV